MTLTNPLADDLNLVLSRTEPLWQELRGKKIFITGGTGFYGCWLLESFAWANNHLDLKAEALVLTRDVAAFQKKVPHLVANPAIQFHPGDVRSFDFPAGHFSHVIHAATEASAKLNEENPDLMFDTIMEGTRHTLEFSRVCGANKFLFTSSGAVYGPQPSDITRLAENLVETVDAAILGSAYGRGKLAAEKLCTTFGAQHGLEIKIARGFAFVGPHLPLDTHFAIGNFIRDALAGGPIQVTGDGTSVRSYLYPSELAIWLWTILFRGTNARAYNVGSEFCMTTAEVARAVSECFSPSLQVKVLKEPTSQPPSRYVPSTRRAREELGLTQQIEPCDAIRKTIRWLQDQNAACK